MIRHGSQTALVLVRGTGPTAKRRQVMGHTAMGAIVSVGIGGIGGIDRDCLGRKEVDILRLWLLK